MPKVVNIIKKWGDKSVFEGFSLDFAEKKTTAIMGRSGIGKTTLFSIMSSLTSFEGQIEGFENLSYVFQEPRLVPFLTVKENLKFVVDGKIDPTIVDEKIDEYLELTEVIDLKEKLASKLSGGEKQRVSLARAFLYPSDVILSDEPFSSLDLGLKVRIMGVYADLLKFSPRTSIFVTHSIDEALFLADDVVVLKEGGYEMFSVHTEKEERKFGYEEDLTLRAKLYELLS